MKGLLRFFILLFIFNFVMIGIVGCTNVDNSNTAKLIKDLEAHELKVTNITNEVKKELPNSDKLKTTVLLVEGSERVYIEIPPDVEEFVKESISTSTSPAIDFTGKPHLYVKAELVISYFGQNEKLLHALEEILGKSLVN